MCDLTHHQHNSLSTKPRHITWHRNTSNHFLIIANFISTTRPRWPHLPTSPSFRNTTSFPNLYLSTSPNITHRLRHDRWMANWMNGAVEEASSGSIVLDKKWATQVTSQYTSKTRQCESITYLASGHTSHWRTSPSTRQPGLWAFILLVGNNCTVWIIKSQPGDSGLQCISTIQSQPCHETNFKTLLQTFKFLIRLQIQPTTSWVNDNIIFTDWQQIIRKPHIELNIFCFGQNVGSYNDNCRRPNSTDG